LPAERLHLFDAETGMTLRTAGRTLAAA